MSSASRPGHSSNGGPPGSGLSAASAAAETVLVTGFPSYVAKRMVRKVVAADASVRVVMLARDKFQAAAHEFIAGLPPELGARVEIALGDICDMDLGLAGADYRTLVDRVTAIHHLAAIYHHGVPRDQTRRVNVEGTKNVLEMAGDCGKLTRLCHYSTASVSGDRKGVITEDELDENQGFHNAYEETKFLAERLVRGRLGKLPITIFRPGIIVGDSQSGEIDKFDGPYYLMVLIVTSPLDVHLPLPGKGSAPLSVVPVDFVVDAAHALWRSPEAAGKTYHLTDPAPLAARTIYEVIAARAHKKAPRGSIPSGIARALLRTPGLAKMARAPLAFLDAFNHMAFYNCRNTLEDLRATGIYCPSFERYVDNLIGYVREVHAQRKQKLDAEVFDPFD